VDSRALQDIANATSPAVDSAMQLEWGEESLKTWFGRDAQEQMNLEPEAQPLRHNAHHQRRRLLFATPELISQRHERNSYAFPMHNDHQISTQFPHASQNVLLLLPHVPNRRPPPHHSNQPRRRPPRPPLHPLRRAPPRLRRTPPPNRLQRRHPPIPHLPQLPRYVPLQRPHRRV